MDYPTKIYLQRTDPDSIEHTEITWADARVHDADVAYLKVDEVMGVIDEKISHYEGVFDSIDLSKHTPSNSIGKKTRAMYKRTALILLKEHLNELK